MSSHVVPFGSMRFEPNRIVEAFWDCVSKILEDVINANIPAYQPATLPLILDHHWIRPPGYLCLSVSISSHRCYALLLLLFGTIAWHLCNEIFTMLFSANSYSFQNHPPKKQYIKEIIESIFSPLKIKQNNKGRNGIGFFFVLINGIEHVGITKTVWKSGDKRYYPHIKYSRHLIWLVWCTVRMVVLKILLRIMKNKYSACYEKIKRESERERDEESGA